MAVQVLIVDDDTAHLAVLRDSLARHADRFRVVTAPDGVEALAVLRREHVDLVVTDLRMPRMDGFALLLRLAQEYPHIPRMVMTSLNSPVSQYQAERADIIDYLIKPFAPDFLANKILGLVDKRGESGFLKGISISAFVQLVDIEQKTCTITVRNSTTERSGTLFFRDGRLLNAQLGERAGLDAACAILGWSSVQISITDHCPDIPDSVRRRIQDVLMQAAQRVDEAGPEVEPPRAAAPATVAPRPVPAPAPSAADDDLFRKLSMAEIKDRAFDAHKEGRLHEELRCWQAVLGREPGNRMAEHNLRLLAEKIRKAGG